jgi:hypothetical protein
MNVLHAFERTDLAINMVRSFKKEYIPESAVLLMQHVQAWRMDQANNGLSDKETQRLMSKEWREMLTEQYPTLQALWASCPKPINFTSLV